MKLCTITSVFRTTFHETEPFLKTVYKERQQIKNYAHVLCLRGAAAGLLSKICSNSELNKNINVISNVCFLTSSYSHQDIAPTGSPLREGSWYSVLECILRIAKENFLHQSSRGYSLRSPRSLLKQIAKLPKNEWKHVNETIFAE